MLFKNLLFNHLTSLNITTIHFTKYWIGTMYIIKSNYRLILFNMSITNYSTRIHRKMWQITVLLLLMFCSIHCSCPICIHLCYFLICCLPTMHYQRRLISNFTISGHTFLFKYITFLFKFTINITIIWIIRLLK